MDYVMITPASIGGDRIGPEQEMRFYWCGGREERDGGRRVRLSHRSIRPQPTQTRARTADFLKIVILV
ncbi:hypothetical protein NQZ68_040358 [Dissostichus eleginoides]|nr:hypothetical protein NQZ68_040358 [Dissostichus eleginoides]